MLSQTFLKTYSDYRKADWIETIDDVEYASLSYTWAAKYLPSNDSRRHTMLTVENLSNILIMMLHINTLRDVDHWDEYKFSFEVFLKYLEHEKVTFPTQLK